jgi:hypothetical protein
MTGLQVALRITCLSLSLDRAHQGVKYIRQLTILIRSLNQNKSSVKAKTGFNLKNEKNIEN